MKVGPAGNVDGYEHGKQLWLQQVGNHQDDPQVIRNAARLVFLSDLKLGRELLGKALAINGRIALGGRHGGRRPVSSCRRRDARLAAT